MRTETDACVAAVECHQVVAELVVEAILQTDVDVVVDRCAHAGECLPCEARVAVDDVDRRECSQHANLDAANTGTTADEALQAVIGAEVDQAVDHEAQSFSTATNLRVVERHVVINVTLFFSTAKAGFGFQTERTEVVTDDATDVVTDLGVERADFIGTRKVVDIFDNHTTGVELNVPSVIFCQGWRCKGRRGHRHSYDEFAHYNFPFLRNWSHRVEHIYLSGP